MTTKGRQKSAADRLLAISEMLEHNRQRGPYHGPEKRPCLDRIAQQIAAENQISKATVWRWTARFKAGGYAALGRQRRTDAGSCRFLRNRPFLRPFVERRLQAGQNPYSLFRDMRRLFPALDVPSYETLRGLAKRITADALHRITGSAVMQ